MRQKDIFLQSEGDAWFMRNRQSVSDRKLPGGDCLLQEMIAFLPSIAARRLRVLEIGCGDGTRMEWVSNNLNADCFGIDPSVQAVSAARAKGVNAQQGTADALPFDSQSFDVVIFGFCLYLCDREDLFRIASEADRVLRSPGWLMIEDFFSPMPRARAYRHHPDVQTYKMDFRTLFTWHPDYVCMSHKIRHHGGAIPGEGNFTDDPEEWVASSVLRKCQRTPGA